MSALLNVVLDELLCVLLQDAVDLVEEIIDLAGQFVTDCGVAGLLEILIWAAFIGGVLGALFLLVNGALLSTVQRIANGLAITFFTRRWTYLSPEPGSAATRALPFACVLGLAVVADLFWGTPWA